MTSLIEDVAGSIPAAVSTGARCDSGFGERGVDPVMVVRREEQPPKTPSDECSPGSPRSASGPAEGESGHPIPMRESDVPGVAKALLTAVLGSTDNGKFFSISSAASPPASRNGTSSRSLRVLARSSALLAYLPALLFAAISQTRLDLAQDTASGGEDESAKTGGRS